MTHANTRARKARKARDLLRSEILTQLRQGSEVSVVCNAAWLVTVARTYVAKWCEENDLVMHELPTEHIAQDLESGRAPKFRYKARTGRKLYRPKPEVHWRLSNMPEKAIPAGSLVEFTVSDVDELDNGDIEVVLRYEGHSE